MATSGTVGNTVISTVKLIEKALRRCGLSPASATAETIETAKEDLYMLLMSMSNRGLNLWCIDSQTVPLVAGQAVYVLPPGTTDVLNLNLATPVGDGSFRDLPVTPLNRDDYASLPNKAAQSAVPINYYFEKLREPQITLWPVPSDASKHLVVYRYRAIQDVGEIGDELDIPARWLEAITWHLALRLAFELPEVKAERVTLVQSMAQSMTLEVEGGETDSAPTYFAPNIGCYTR